MTTRDPKAGIVSVPAILSPVTISVPARSYSEKVCAYVTEQAENGKFAAAICAAPSVLGTLGVLEGKKAVCFPGFEKYLRGAEIVNEKVVRDGNVITAVGMGAAFEFGFELVAALFGEKTAKDLELSSKYTLS